MSSTAEQDTAAQDQDYANDLRAWEIAKECESTPGLLAKVLEKLNGDSNE